MTEGLSNVTDAFSGVTMVWLDLDDTLWDFEGNSHEALGEIYAAFDLDRFWPDLDSWFDDYHKINSRLWQLYAAGQIDRGFLRMERFRLPLVGTGLIDDVSAREMACRLDADYLGRLAVRGRTVPGAKDLLDRLVASGYRLGILSNGFKEVQYGKMASSGIDAYMDVVVLSDEIEVNKPDERIYRYAEQKARVSPSDCIMIGDNPDTDIKGALNAGWKAIMFDRTGNCDNVPCPVVSSLDDILPLPCPGLCAKTGKDGHL